MDVKFHLFLVLFGLILDVYAAPYSTHDLEGRDAAAIHRIVERSTQPEFSPGDEPDIPLVKRLVELFLKQEADHGYSGQSGTHSGSGQEFGSAVHWEESMLKRLMRLFTKKELDHVSSGQASSGQASSGHDSSGHDSSGSGVLHSTQPEFSAGDDSRSWQQAMVKRIYGYFQNKDFYPGSSTQRDNELGSSDKSDWPPAYDKRTNTNSEEWAEAEFIPERRLSNRDKRKDRGERLRAIINALKSLYRKENGY